MLMLEGQGFEDAKDASAVGQGYKVSTTETFLNTTINPKKQPITDVDALKADAVTTHPKLKHAAMEIIHMANADMLQVTGEEGNLRSKSYVAGPEKTEARVKEKAGDYLGNVAGIFDFARGKINAHSPEEIAALCSAIEWYFLTGKKLPGGMVVTAVENKFQNPTHTGYVSFKAHLLAPMTDGPRPYHMCELMIVHEGFEAQIEREHPNKYKASSHALYEISRTLVSIFGRETLGATEVASQTLGSVVQANKMLHLKARKQHGLMDIDFEPFRQYRFNQADQPVKAADPGILPDFQPSEA